MKTNWMRPGFELMFAVSIILIMTLPLLVFAQGTKNMDITIINGDTTINGKNIKDLSPDDRQQALKDISHLNGPEIAGRRRILLRQKGPADTGANKIILKRRFNSEDNTAQTHGFFNDSTNHVFKFKMRRPQGNDSTFTFNYRMNMDRGDDFDTHEPNLKFRMRNPWREDFHHRQMQRFEYTSTGSDGISTHASFRVNNASPEKIRSMTGSEKAELEIKDLNIAAEFSSGKTLLLFGLPSKSAAEVKLTDNDGKLVWSEKILNGSFNKSFALGLNGVYYLQVKQGGKVALKRIVKED